MIVAAHMLVGALLMAAGVWLTNSISGQVRCRREISAIGWGIPAGVATLMSGLHPLQALWVAVAVAAGAMVPPTPAERLGCSSGHVIAEACELFLEGVLRLTPLGLVFWACNLYWPKAVEAAAFILPGYLFGAILHPHVSLRGVRTPTDIGALLFAGTTGALLAVTPMLPAHGEWPPLPEAISALDQQMGR